MRKLIVGAQVSMDGVMQAPGGPDEDPTKGFPFGSWAMPYGCEEFGKEIMCLFEDFDLLLGRKTYEIFAAYWPYYDEGSEHGGIATLFNKVKKYVVSGSGKVETTWENTVLLRDIDAVKRLKQENGPNLVTQGSTELIHSLFAADLVDQVSLFLVPAVLGQGKKLWKDGSTPHAFKLARSRVAPNGLVVLHYEKDGAVKQQKDPFGVGYKPSELEMKRRERMKKEG